MILGRDLGRSLDAVGNKYLHRITEFDLNDFVPTEWLLVETGSKSVTNLVHERPLRLYGQGQVFQMSILLMGLYVQKTIWVLET